MPRAPRRDAALAFAVALAARIAVVIWAKGRIPPTADGTYYERIAESIAAGHGYTWVWGDGAVTYAAHYPVGYPALVGALYAITGPRPAAAMVLNAVIGALAAFAVHRLAARAMGRWPALAAALLVALHPGLVAYTPAIMTEGVTASLIACALAVAAWARDRIEALPEAAPLRATAGPAAAIGLVLGLATLVRPQSLVLAPAFGLLAAVGTRRRWAVAACAATAAALLVCAPWTARNCVRMHRCALVSVNGGWNLLIGADPASTGAWAEIKVPKACEEVFDEAEKDVCFGREARRYVEEHPAAWLSLAPKKLAATFDYAGAAPWYLHQSNPKEFPWQAKVALGKAETAYALAVLILALVWATRRASWHEPLWARAARSSLALAGVGLAAITLHPWIAYAALLVASVLRGPSLWKGPILASGAAVVLAATMATHAVFFGSGRYSLVVFPLVAALAPLSFARPRRGSTEGRRLG